MSGLKLERYVEGHPELLTYKNDFVVLEDYWGNKDAMAAIDITNKFTFQERMNCSFQGNPTPMEVYEKIGSRLLKQYDDKRKVWEHILKRHSHCTQYPIPHCMGILNLFKPKRWLDPTAGWGDRLLSAIAYGCDYVGVDTNTSLFPKYDAILRKYVEKGDFKLINDSFLTAKLGQRKFDLVFTSPPFSMYEIYEGMAEWKSAADFMQSFLFPMIQKSANALLKNGHLILYIMDPEEGQKYISEMLKYVESEIQELNFEGVVYYQGTKPRPHFIWKKL